MKRFLLLLANHSVEMSVVWVLIKYINLFVMQKRFNFSIHLRLSSCSFCNGFGCPSWRAFLERTITAWTPECFALRLLREYRSPLVHVLLVGPVRVHHAFFLCRLRPSWSRNSGSGSGRLSSSPYSSGGELALQCSTFVMGLAAFQPIPFTCAVASSPSGSSNTHHYLLGVCVCVLSL